MTSFSVARYYHWAPQAKSELKKPGHEFHGLHEKGRRLIADCGLRARAEINSHFGASAGRADARRRDEGDVGHRRGAATTPIRALRRRAPPGCGPQARWLCCSLLTYRPGYSSSLAPRQRAWGPAAKWEVISARALSPQVRCPPLASTVLKHPQALAASILATLCGLRVFAVNSSSVSPRRH